MHDLPRNLGSCIHWPFDCLEAQAESARLRADLAGRDATLAEAAEALAGRDVRASERKAALKASEESLHLLQDALEGARAEQAADNSLHTRSVYCRLLYACFQGGSAL